MMQAVIFAIGGEVEMVHIAKLIQDTELKNKESVYGVPHDRGAHALVRKNKINN